MMETLNLSMPLEKLPDCPPKFKKILERSKTDPNWKYTDENWSPITDEKKVLGDRVYAEKDNRGIT